MTQKLNLADSSDKYCIFGQSSLVVQKILIESFINNILKKFNISTVYLVGTTQEKKYMLKHLQNHIGKEFKTWAGPDVIEHSSDSLRIILLNPEKRRSTVTFDNIIELLWCISKTSETSKDVLETLQDLNYFVTNKSQILRLFAYLSEFKEKNIKDFIYNFNELTKDIFRSLSRVNYTELTLKYPDPDPEKIHKVQCMRKHLINMLKSIADDNEHAAKHHLKQCVDICKTKKAPPSSETSETSEASEASIVESFINILNKRPGKGAESMLNNTGQQLIPGLIHYFNKFQPSKIHDLISTLSPGIDVIKNIDSIAICLSKHATEHSLFNKYTVGMNLGDCNSNINCKPPEECLKSEI